MFDKKTFCSLVAVGLSMTLGLAQAKVSPEEAAQLGITGTPLTPMGAERAGNKEGTIPEWTGGITEVPAGFTAPNTSYIDPYADDKILFTIDSSNYQQYEDKLSPGNVALIKKYPNSYKMHVYPSRRSAAYPQYVYEGTISNASTTEFCADGTPDRCIHLNVYKPGVAFPIPKSGAELMWNRTNTYWGGESFTSTGVGFNVYADGAYATTVFANKWTFPQWMPEKVLPDHPYYHRFGRALFCRGQESISPPRSAGQIFGGCTFMENTDFDGYIYIPGQRRVRKAPELGFYDSPSTGSDGLRTADSYFGFLSTGEEEWYEFEAPRKQELFIPYNNYKMTKAGLTFDDVIHPGHINPDLIRYELHRNWVVNATLKEGYRHLGPKRMAWSDEDSWTTAEAVMWDAKGEMWRVTETYLMSFYEVPLTYFWGDSHMDLVSGRYSSNDGFFNVGLTAGLGVRPLVFNQFINPGDFTPAGLRKLGVR